MVRYREGTAADSRLAYDLFIIAKSVPMLVTGRGAS